MKKILLAFILFFSWTHSAECVVRKVEAEKGNGDFWTERLQGVSCGELERFLRDSVDALADNGYPFARVSFSGDSAGALQVSFDRGSAWVWASAENAEESKSTRETFARLSGLVAGTPVRLSDLKRAEQKLIRSGYFESTAAPRLFRDSVRNRLFPVFSMRDLSVNSFEGVLSYASGDGGGFAGNISLFLYNMRGTGRDLNVSGDFGDWRRSLFAAYREPWLFGSGWNGIVRGSFDEDSTSRRALFEAGLSRNIGFFFDVAVLGGIGNDRLTYSLEADFRNLDRIVLPRHGQSFSGVFRVIRERSDVSHDFTTDLHANGEVFTPVFRNIVLKTSFFVGTLLPTGRDFKRDMLYSLGGLENLKGYRPDFFRTRAYGISEMDLQWRIAGNTALHAYFEPGLHRAESPAHGWMDTYGYGFGISQYRNSWSFSLFYALHTGTGALEGLLHFGIRALF